MIEFLTLLSTAKAMGFDLTRIMEIIVIFFMVLCCLTIILWRLSKPVTAGINKATSSIESLTKTLQEHIVQTDIKMGEGERRFDNLDTRIKKIETHVGIS